MLGRCFVKKDLFNLSRFYFILVAFLFVNPCYLRAQTCASIDSNLSTIAAGAIHTVGLKEDGTVIAIGANRDGQLNVSDWTNIKAIAAGGAYTVGLKDDGTVVATGGMGQAVSNWTNIQAIAISYHHIAGLKEDGTVVTGGGVLLDVSGWTDIKAVAAGGRYSGSPYTVGLRKDGTVLAVGSGPDVSGWTNIKAIAAGMYHTVGLKEDGTVVAVGEDSSGQLNVSGWTNIKAIAAGVEQTVGLKEDGTVVAVGYNYPESPGVSDWANIKAIAAGQGHIVGLKEDGAIVTVGDFRDGQHVSTPEWAKIREVAISRNFTVGLNEDGTVVGVGLNSSGQLNVSNWTNIKAVAVRYNDTYGLKEDGSVAATGSRTLDVSNWSNIKAISTGDSNILGLREDGTVIEAGYNYWVNYWGPSNASSWSNIKAVTAGKYFYAGVRQDGTVVAVGYPMFNVSSWTNIKDIAAGSGHIAGLREDGTVMLSGLSGWDNGRLQMEVSNWTNVKAIAASEYYTVGLKEDGTVVATGETPYQWMYLDVSGWRDIKSIAAGRDSIMGVREDGTVVATSYESNWGELNVSYLTNIRQPYCMDSAIAPPSFLSVSDTPCDNGGSIGLSWALSPDDSTLSSGSKKVNGYNVYRSDISGGTYTAVATVSAGTGSYTDNSSTTGTTYYYVVKATDGTNESTASNEASAASTRDLPLSPANLTATDTPNDLGGSITLNWTKSVDDGAGLNNVSGYNIYRYSSMNGNIALLLSIPAGTTGYMDNTTADTDTYYYFIKAIDNQCGMESPASIAASGQSVNNFTALPGFVSTLPGISAQTVDSLTSKVENAIASFESGNTTTAINKLNALLNEISAQSGKGIETTAAQTLTNYVQNLIAYINIY